jgi:hypothetical protein
MTAFFSRRAFIQASMLCFALIALTACGDDDDTPPATDLGVRDAGRNDAGEDEDAAAPRDASAGDASTPDDASAGDAGGACATAIEDAPCTETGASCGGPCTDSCSFCNILRCEGGRWTRLEVFPDPTCAMTFPCDTGGLRCDRGDEFCSIARSDVGGEPDVIRCEPKPTACTMLTCACFPSGTGSTCSDAGDGAVTVTYLGG